MLSDLYELSFALRNPKKEEEEDDPMSGFIGGGTTVAVGTLAVVFAKKSYARTTREMTTIIDLWN